MIGGDARLYWVQTTLHRTAVQPTGKARSIWALAYPRTEQKQTAKRPLGATFSQVNTSHDINFHALSIFSQVLDAMHTTLQGSTKQAVHDSSVSDRAVMYLVRWSSL